MAKGLPGADSSIPVTSQVEGEGLIALATNHFGAVPAFWGRYFTSTTSNTPAEYHHVLEGPPLSASGIRVLPVARQTRNVNGTTEQGATDGAANAADLLASFGASAMVSQGNVFYIFLDVEGDPTTDSPSLSAAYYTGWAQAVTATSTSATNGQVTIRPCIYATQGDGVTWAALTQAMASGADCGGAWMARYLTSGCSEFPDWNDEFVTPRSGMPQNCPILAWQFAGNCLSGSIDCSQTNPALDPNETLLKFLMLPPG